MTTGNIRIRPARGADDLAAVRLLFQDYERSLEIDLGYQGFAAELAGLPGKYAPPGGEILLARDAGEQPLGCIALRPLPEPGRCEMKRLFVAPEGRGTGLGKALVGAITGTARSLGYREMWLDTLPSMKAAQSLYRAMGFEKAHAYYDTPVTGTVFMRLRLSA